MNLYGLFLLDANIKYIVFSILYRHINVPMACTELIFFFGNNYRKWVCLIDYNLCSLSQIINNIPNGVQCVSTALDPGRGGR